MEKQAPVNYNRQDDIFSLFPGIKGDLGNIMFAKEQAVNGKKVKGFEFDLPVGISKFSIDLSGTARQLLGIKFIKPTNTSLKSTLTINNDVIWRDTFVNLLSTDNVVPQEFFVYLRALSGQDTIDLGFEAVTAEIARVNFYYI